MQKKITTKRLPSTRPATETKRGHDIEAGGRTYTLPWGVYALRHPEGYFLYHGQNGVTPFAFYYTNGTIGGRFGMLTIEDMADEPGDHDFMVGLIGPLSKLKPHASNAGFKAAHGSPWWQGERRK